MSVWSKVMEVIFELVTFVTVAHQCYFWKVVVTLKNDYELKRIFIKLQFELA